MRKQEKIIVWPAYFDSARSRQEGRRVSKSLAVASPRVEEVKEVAEKLGLTCELVPEAGYPRAPWPKGLLLVEKKESKNQTIAMIAKQLLKMRSALT